MASTTDWKAVALAAGTAGLATWAVWQRSHAAAAARAGFGGGGAAGDALSPRAKLQRGVSLGGGFGGITAPVPASAADVKHVFTITPANGFLPLLPPVTKLPDSFAALDAVLARLPDLLHDAAPDALARAVAGVPEYPIPAGLGAAVMQALMRDYSVLVSAYLLEGKTKSGAPRTTVPRNIAVPFAAVATALDEQWIMSYDSYCLTNCVSTAGGGPGSDGLMRYKPGQPQWRWDQLRLVRAFDGGPEETTFVTVHFEIESNTGALVASFDEIVAGLRRNDLPAVKAGLASLRGVQERLIVSQLSMFNASDPRNYESHVRPWIFGWKGNPDFATGVTFEGTGKTATQLRGETGAQSTIIPSLDIMLGITHKSDALRAMLAELEAYRPAPHRDWLAKLRVLMWGEDAGVGLAPETRGERAPSVGVPATSSYTAKAAHHAGAVDGVVGGVAGVADDVAAPHALRDFIRASGDVEAVKAFNACVGLVWAFRDIHVTFSALYIGKYSDKATATGGTPYKVYLRKHRDESIAHQIADYGDAAMARFTIPTLEAFEAELDGVLRDGTGNGIPPHLMARHAAIIAAHGGGAASLSRKAFPLRA